MLKARWVVDRDMENPNLDSIVPIKDRLFKNRDRLKNAVYQSSNCAASISKIRFYPDQLDVGSPTSLIADLRVCCLLNRDKKTATKLLPRMVEGVGELAEGVRIDWAPMMSWKKIAVFLSVYPLGLLYAKAESFPILESYHQQIFKSKLLASSMSRKLFGLANSGSTSEASNDAAGSVATDAAGS